MNEDKKFDYKNFIARVDGLVHFVNGYNKPMSHTPFSEMVMGGESPRYKTGYQGRLEIEIVSSKQQTVKRIIFNGNSPVLAGQKITAYVLKADEKQVNPTFYVERKFREEETALWLDILGQDGIVIRRDYGVDYPQKD